MPFTLSHPAAVLPLRRFSRLPFAALVAGSVAPDTGYFFSPAQYFRADAHTLTRSFTFCVPMALALLAAFTVCRPGLLRLLPGGIREEIAYLSEPNPWRPARLPFTVVATWLGALTHLLWDSWTHRNGFFVTRLTILRLSLPGDILAHRFLQYLSSVMGLLLLYRFLSARARRNGHPIRWQRSWRWAFWSAALLLAAAFSAATLRLPWNYWLSANEHRLVYLAIFTVMRNFTALVGACALALRITARNFTL